MSFYRIDTDDELLVGAVKKLRIDQVLCFFQGVVIQHIPFATEGVQVIEMNKQLN